MGEILLPHFKPLFSEYVLFVKSSSSSSVLVNGDMETFRYFPVASPIFHLKALSAAQEWMRTRNLTSAIHVRRGDYTPNSAPLDFSRQNMVRQAVVVTDDPEWVRLHASVFGECVLSTHNKDDPGFDMALLILPKSGKFPNFQKKGDSSLLAL